MSFYGVIYALLCHNMWRFITQYMPFYHSTATSRIKIVAQEVVGNGKYLGEF